MHIIYAAIVAAVSVADGHWSIAAAVPAPPLPTLPRSSCVVDETGSLRPKTIETLQQICLGLDQSGKGQLVVAVVRGLHGRSDIAKLKTRRLYEFKETDIGTLSDPDSPRGLARMRVTATHLEPLPSAADATTTGPDQSLTAPAKESPPREVDDKQPNAQPQADGVEHQPEDGETN